MSYFVEGLEVAALFGLIYCVGAFIWLTIADRVDFHYSKKRGEI